MADERREAVKPVCGSAILHREETAESASERRRRESERKREKNMAKMMKSLKMRGMYVLHFVLVTAVMMAAWFTQYAPALNPLNARTVNIAVSACSSS